MKHCRKESSISWNLEIAISILELSGKRVRGITTYIWDVDPFYLVFLFLEDSGVLRSDIGPSGADPLVLRICHLVYFIIFYLFRFLGNFSNFIFKNLLRILGRSSDKGRMS